VFTYFEVDGSIISVDTSYDTALWYCEVDTVVDTVYHCLDGTMGSMPWRCVRTTLDTTWHRKVAVYLRPSEVEALSYLLDRLIVEGGDLKITKTIRVHCGDYNAIELRRGFSDRGWGITSTAMTDTSGIVDTLH
jgi:hypothetical protein